ncbi:MAG: ABC transporter permease [Candidatus Heimdallarchaeota archaeon]|nr:ABC transporter permease [Candidatus Heimdallarchaeota archaeon]
MKRDSNGLKKSRRYLLQNFFITTRSFYSFLFNSKLAEMANYQRFMFILMWVLSPIILVILPIVDIVTMFFLPGLHLFKPLFKAGWKYALISSVGVTLAVSVITQYVFFIYSYQFQAFDLYLAEEDRRYVQVEVESVNIGATYDHYNSFARIAELAVEFANVTDRVSQIDLFFRRSTFTQTFDPLYNESILPNMPLYGTHGKLWTYLEQNIANGTAPEPFSDDQVLVLMTRDFYNHSTIDPYSPLDLYIPVSLDIEDSLTDPGAQTVVNVTGIIFLDDLQKYNVLEYQYGIPLETVLELTDSAAVISLWPIAANRLHDIAKTVGTGDIIEDLFYDVTEIDAFKLQDEITKLKILGNELKESYLTFAAYLSVRITSPLINLIEQFRNEYNLYQTFMLAFLAPIIALTVILTVYAANLVRKKRDRQLTILADRGTSRVEIGSYLSLESFIVGTVSLAVGVAGGIPIASLLTRSSGYLSFNNDSIPLTIELSSVSVAVFGSIGAIILIQLFNTITLLRKRNIDDYGKVEKKLPAFYKYYVDVAIAVVGIALWYIYEMPALAEFKYRTARYIGIPAIVLLLFGLILAAQRLLPLFAKLLIRVSIKLRLDIPSLSLREIFRYQKSYSRSSIILCLSFSLVVTSIVVPYTYQDFNYEGAQYDLGSDILIRNFPLEDPVLKETLENMEQVEATSIVRFVNIRDPQGLTTTVSILAIDPDTYKQAAHFRDDFSQTPLDEILDDLAYARDVNSSYVIGQVDELELFGYTKGSEMTMTYWAYNESNRDAFGSPFFYTEVTFKFLDTYNVWPQFLTSLILDNVRATYFHFVAPLNIMDFLQYNYLSSINYLYVKVKDGYDISDTADEIAPLVGSSVVYDVERQLFVKPDSPRSSILYSAINSTLLMSFAINAIILGLFASIQLIDKNKELATMKAIGISSGQLNKYFISIYATMLSFSTIMGLVIGFIASILLMSILSINRNIPSYHMKFPIGQIAIVLSILLAASLAGAVIPTMTMSKTEVGTELRQSA